MQKKYTEKNYRYHRDGINNDEKDEIQKKNNKKNVKIVKHSIKKKNTKKGIMKPI